MANELTTYVKTKRAEGIADDQIKANLLAQGWPSEQVEAGLKANLDDDVPAPQPQAPVPAQVSPPMNSPAITPVVSSFSTISVEYIIMFIGLWISAATIAALLHALIDTANGANTFSDILPFSSACLIVALPIFGFMFLRLRRKEASDPEIRRDSSRRQAVRLTLLVTFVTAIGSFIGYIYSLLNHGAGIANSYSFSTYHPVTDLLHLLVTLVIAGGIFIYYWQDIHRSES